MFFVTFTLFFGLMFAYRALESHVSQRFITKKLAIKLLFMIAIIQIFVIYIIPNSIFGILEAIFVPILIVRAHFWLLVRYRERKFVDNFCHLLDLIVLEMRSGQSFRVSLLNVGQRQEPFIQQKLLILGESLRFSTKRDLGSRFLNSIREEFLQIDANPHNSMGRLNTLRFKFRTLSDFRHKSGQAMQQSRAQAIVLIGLYFATLVFVWRNFRIWESPTLLLLSGILFLFGTAYMFFFVGRMKWKI